MIVWLMMMHHHTNFDHSDIVQNLHCDLDLEYSKATFSQDTPAYDHALSTKLFAKNQQFKTYYRNSRDFIV